MHFTRRAFLTFWLVVLALVAGCANTAAKRTASGLELDLQAKAGEGFAILRVIALRPISLLNPKWQSVHISANGQRSEMNDITLPTNAMFSGRYFATESLYFARLDAGHYDVTGFGSIGAGPGLIPALLASDRSEASPRLPAFRVEAGRIANLGTIVFVPAIEKDRAEQLFLLDGPMGKQNALAALQGESKPGGSLPLTEGGGWVAPGTAEGEQRLLAQAREHVSMLYVRPAAGGFTAGSHLGQVFRRAGPGRLEREFVDTLGTVFSATRTASGLSVAGGEYGTYYVKGANGTWQSHRLPGDTGRIVFLEPRGNDGIVLVTTSGRGSRFWTSESISDAKVAPQERVKVPVMADALLSTRDEWVLPSNIPGISRETELHRVEKSTFATRKQTESFWVVDWQMLGDRQVMLTRQNGLSAYVSKSSDSANTWTHGQTSGGISNYWLDANTAYNLDSSAGFSMVDNLLQKTTDGGQTWRRVGVPLATRDFAGRIVYADASEVVLQGGNMLYASRDEGKTWTRLLPATARP